MKHFDFTLETPIGRAIRTSVDDETLPNAFFGPRYQWLTKRTEVPMKDSMRVVGTSFIDCKCWTMDLDTILQTTITFANITIIETANKTGKWHLTLLLDFVLPHSATPGFIDQDLAKIVELSGPFAFLNSMKVNDIRNQELGMSVYLIEDWHQMNVKLCGA